MSNQIILDQPLPAVTEAIDPVLLSQINDAWMHNAMLLGYFCLAVGFTIGAVSIYFYMRNKYADTD
jgi:vacuolar-type H+-ATPase subunit I/STV1